MQVESTLNYFRNKSVRALPFCWVRVICKTYLNVSGKRSQLSIWVIFGVQHSKEWCLSVQN